jgi:hypothetical protein
VDGYGGDDSNGQAGGAGLKGIGGSAEGTGGYGIYGIGGTSTGGSGGVGVYGVGGTGLSGAVGPAAYFDGDVDVHAGTVGLDGLIDYGATGVASPNTAPGVGSGWRIVLYQGSFSAATDYGIGISGNTLWNASSEDFLWYSSNGSTYDPRMLLDGGGNLTIQGTMTTDGSPDLAETIAASPDVTAADVVCADGSRAEHVVRCARGDRAVLGVIADGTSSFLVNAHGGSVNKGLTGKPLVLAGRVPVKVSLENGPVSIGDFLAPSSTPGVAMRMTEPGRSVGIALAPYDGHSGADGSVLCFVKVGDANTDVELADLRSENATLRAETSALRAESEALRARSDEMRSRLDRMEQLMTALLESNSAEKAKRAALGDLAGKARTRRVP